jgi:hypothetical protein
VAEVIILEMRHMTEPEHEIAVAELEHEAALSKVAEMPWLEAWKMPELELKSL